MQATYALLTSPFRKKNSTVTSNAPTDAPRQPSLIPDVRDHIPQPDFRYTTGVLGTQKAVKGRGIEEERGEEEGDLEEEEEEDTEGEALLLQQLQDQDDEASDFMPGSGSGSGSDADDQEPQGDFVRAARYLNLVASASRSTSRSSRSKGGQVTAPSAPNVELNSASHFQNKTMAKARTKKNDGTWSTVLPSAAGENSLGPPTRRVTLVRNSQEEWRRNDAEHQDNGVTAERAEQQDRTSPGSSSSASPSPTKTAASRLTGKRASNQSTTSTTLTSKALEMQKKLDSSFAKGGWKASESNHTASSSGLDNISRAMPQQQKKHSAREGERRLPSLLKAQTLTRRTQLRQQNIPNPVQQPPNDVPVVKNEEPTEILDPSTVLVAEKERSKPIRRKRKRAKSPTPIQEETDVEMEDVDDGEDVQMDSPRSSTAAGAVESDPVSDNQENPRKRIKPLDKFNDRNGDANRPPAEPPKRKRGRPRKNLNAPTGSASVRKTAAGTKNSVRSSAESSFPSLEVSVAPGSQARNNTLETDERPVRGVYTKDEEKLLKKFRDRYCARHQITRARFNIMVQSSQKGDLLDGAEKTAFWKEIREQLPHRETRSLERYMRRNFHNLTQDKWTAEDDDELERLVAENGRHWTIIAGMMDRTHNEVFRRYVQFVEIRDVQRKRAWSKEEVDGLLEAVLKYAKLVSVEGTAVELLLMQREPWIPWQVISKMIGHTRSMQQCAGKWLTLQKKVRRERDESGGLEVDLFTPKTGRGSHAPRRSTVVKKTEKARKKQANLNAEVVRDTETEIEDEEDPIEEIEGEEEQTSRQEQMRRESDPTESSDDEEDQNEEEEGQDEQEVPQDVEESQDEEEERDEEEDEEEPNDGNEVSRSVTDPVQDSDEDEEVEEDDEDEEEVEGEIVQETQILANADPIEESSDDTSDDTSADTSDGTSDDTSADDDDEVEEEDDEEDEESETEPSAETSNITRSNPVPKPKANVAAKSSKAVARPNTNTISLPPAEGEESASESESGSGSSDTDSSSEEDDSSDSDDDEVPVFASVAKQQDSESESESGSESDEESDNE